MSRAAAAVSYFNEGCNCAQAVISSYCDEWGLDRGTAVKLASAFGGGMGRMGEVCGAVTGALMLIGLQYSPAAQTKDELYELVQQFTADFKARHGSIYCKELIGTEIITAESRKLAADKFKNICPVLVEDAVKILEHIPVK
ncbi:MAG TPA: C-GCAxxG-C-C family protein [Bacillota bacterium]|nr:C-GCAxxG-C-C family protein [Bacillota bacterium]